MINMSAELQTVGLEARPAPEVLRVLVANHREFLGFLEKRVGSRALAEDILQDAFVRGMDKLETLRSDVERESIYRLLRRYGVQLDGNSVEPEK